MTRVILLRGLRVLSPGILAARVDENPHETAAFRNGAGVQGRTTIVRLLVFYLRFLNDLVHSPCLLDRGDPSGLFAKNDWKENEKGRTFFGPNRKVGRIVQPRRVVHLSKVFGCVLCANSTATNTKNDGYKRGD